MPMRGKGEKKIRLKHVNPQITCKLCKGYLIEATTITECLHTFCKSCIVKFLEEHNTCPTCKLVIHQSHPLNYISHDRTMQDIVYKLVPNLQEKEKKREASFYKERGLVNPSENSGLDDDDVKVNSISVDENQDYHRYDEQVNICLEGSEETSRWRELKKKYIRCSSHTTITQLKKFLALKLFKNMEKFKNVDILCNDELLGKDHTLKFVVVTRWRFKDCPLNLTYRPKFDIV
ncbi:polycomb group RING finger protein 3-like [Tubulanus polymorphus]|uniref:polycomb group RING finger protein 3-like n=1 Tax=Tubulanus polymorphus TaxID=672921 RepID=UPI003DA3F70C